MSKLFSFSWRCALATLAALSAHAQVATAPATPPPALKTTAAPITQQPSKALPYRSVFDGYQTFTDAKPLAWKDANATVETAGGWRSYAKEAPESAATEAPVPAAAPATPRPDPHAGHMKQ